jgi:hypothetical protein
VNVNLGYLRRLFKGFVDTGSLNAVLLLGCVISERGVLLETMGGAVVGTLGTVTVPRLRVNGRDYGPVTAHVMRSLPEKSDFVVGLRMMFRFGLVVPPQQMVEAVTPGLNAVNDIVTTDAGERAETLNVEDPMLLRIGDGDFSAWFENGMWTARYNWISNKRPGHLKRFNYPLRNADKEEYDKEVRVWIDSGIIDLWKDDKHGPLQNLVPMMGMNSSG